MFEYSQKATTKEYEKGYERIFIMGCKGKMKQSKMNGKKKPKKK